MAHPADSLATIDLTRSGPDRPVICTVRGEVDISNVHLLRVSVDEAFSAGRAVVVDLSGVTYFASAGVRVLFEARIGNAHRVLTIVTGRGVDTILRISGMTSVASCHADLDSAVRAAEA